MRGDPRFCTRALPEPTRWRAAVSSALKFFARPGTTWKRGPRRIFITGASRRI